MLDSNDHRSIAERLDLFHFQEEAPGMVFWHPNGLFLHRLLEDAVREHARSGGYDEVKTPQIIRKSIWQSSGHWQHFYDQMFKIAGESAAPEEAVKPVDCPGHVCLFGARNPSYRELPKRYAEFGLVHRDELSGSLHGLLRLRQFTQDDGHVFCATEEQAESEVLDFCRSVRPFYERFGFERVSLIFATRPEQRAGDDESWDRAESALRNVLAKLAEPYQEAAGAGAFYGPKLEFVLEDRKGRAWTCGTIQFDLVMPKAFDVRYIDASGARRHPVMLHRALYGSLERFLGIVLEQHGSALPAWMCPVQVQVLPVAAAHGPWAKRVSERFRQGGLRVAVDEREETLGKRVAEARNLSVPFIAVVGAREAKDANVTLRFRDGSQRCLSLDDALSELLRAAAAVAA